MLLHDGRVLAVDRPSNLQAALSGRLLEIVTDTPRPPLDLIAKVPGVVDVQAFGDRAHVRLGGGTQEEGLARVTSQLQGQGIGILSARPVEASLEDVFLELIAEK